jgi:hypothetical protein
MAVIHVKLNGVALPAKNAAENNPVAKPKINH